MIKRVVIVVATAIAAAAMPMPMVAQASGVITVDAPDAERCDPLVTRACLLPFPDDYYTVADPSTATGRRVNFQTASMPANAQGVHIDPTEWNRNDGFSPGSPIVTYVEGIDLAKTDAASVTDIGRSLDKEAPIVLLDATTGKRWPYFAEMDARAASDDERALIIRPAINLTEEHRFIVALRNLRNPADETIDAGDAFRAYRDDFDTANPVLERRRPQMESIFKSLKKAGVARKNLFIAWDFTVASAETLAGRMLHIRDDAFEGLGDRAPSFAVTSVKDDFSEQLFRQVVGTFEVPSYLTGDGGPGSRFNLGADGLPQPTGTKITANFICNVPRSAMPDADGPAKPARASLYGHGLLGTAAGINADDMQVLGNTHNFVFCGTDWIGMSTYDIPNVGRVLSDLSDFASVPDRTQQAYLNALFLGRLLRSSDGLVSNPAFQAGGKPVVNTSALFFYGVSQGGVLGGGVTAVAQDWKRAALGVPGMNFANLVTRSDDFDAFSVALNGSYPNALERALLLSVVQMLWDRSETDGYAQHLTTNPYPKTPRHQVLLDEAFGDFQVANIATEIEARTIGARVHRPFLAPGRSPDNAPAWGIPSLPTRGTVRGSALVMWDSGTAAPPVANTPPRDGDDPHEVSRNDPAAQRQISAFLQVNGRFVNVCGRHACTATPQP